MIKILKHFFNYNYIIYNSEYQDAVIIDPSWNFENIDMNLSGLNLKGILLTHHHFDHVNLVEKLTNKWDIPVFMSKDEIDYYHFHCSNLNAIINDDNLTLGQLSINAILTPGHTKGSMCYKIRNNIFTGDTVFIEGCGICNFDGGSPYKIFESIQKLKNIIPNDCIIYPGHSYGESPGKTFDFLLNNNIYFNIDDCEKFVDFRMRKNQKNLFNFK